MISIMLIMTVLYLNSPLNLAADENGLPLSFSGTAYSGAKMQDFWGDDFVVDLAATTITDSMPLLFEHQRGKVIGNADEFTSGNTLSVSGSFYSDIDDDAKLIATKAQRGTQYQMSMGLFDAKTDFINSGKVTVNGQTYDAPIDVLRGGNIREVSIVILGADDQTNAQFFSKHHEDKQMAQKTPDKAVSVDADLSAENSALKTQVNELTASLDLAKSAEAKALADKDALALQLSAISDAARIDAVKSLFLSVGKDYTDETAKPYLAMSQESFDAVAGDFKAKKPAADHLLMSAYDFGDGEGEGDPKEDSARLDLSALSKEQRKMNTEMVGKH